MAPIRHETANRSATLATVLASNGPTRRLGGVTIGGRLKKVTAPRQARNSADVARLDQDVRNGGFRRPVQLDVLALISSGD